MTAGTLTLLILGERTANVNRFFAVKPTGEGGVLKSMVVARTIGWNYRSEEFNTGFDTRSDLTHLFCDPKSCYS